MIELSLADLIQIVILAALTGGIIVTVRANSKKVDALVTTMNKHLLSAERRFGRIEGQMLNIAGGADGEEEP